MTRDEELLEAMHQMRTSMQMLDSPDLPEAQKNKAIENLFDSYQIYHSGNVLTPSINELKKSLIDAVSLKTDEENLPQTLQKIQNLKELWNFSYFKPNDYLNDPFFSTVLKKISSQITALQQSNNRLEQINAAKPMVDSKGIDTLLNSAATITSNKKAAVSKQNTANKKQEELKQFLETIYGEDAQVIQVELRPNGKIKITDNKAKSKEFSVKPYQKGFIIGKITDNLNRILPDAELKKRKNKTKDLLAVLETSNSLSFSAPQSTTRPKETQSYTAQDFCEELGVKLSKAQAPDLSKELKAYNILLSNSPKDATDLLQN